MKPVKCRTTRSAFGSRLEAAAIAVRVRKGAQALNCPYCGWWHVVGYNSLIERPSRPRPRR